MDLQRAYETLGLHRDASVEVVETAYTQLREDCEARVARASTSAIQRRYQEALVELDAARDVIRSSLALRGNGGELDDALALAHAVLGLDPAASPLDVASAYVSLCEELDRDLETAPTEALRRRCHEARAEVDEAYRCCIASLAPGAVPETGDGSYQVQMSSAPFEGEAAEERDELVIVAPEEPDAAGVLEGETPRRRRRGRAVLRFAAATFGVVLVAGVGALGFQLATGTDVVAEVRSLIPARPDPRIVQAQGDAELARRAHDREAARRSQTRAEEAQQKRGSGLEQSLAAGEDGAASASGCCVPTSPVPGRAVGPWRHRPGGLLREVRLRGPATSRWPTDAWSSARSWPRASTRSARCSGLRRSTSP